MTLIEQLSEDLKGAMKTGNRVRVDTIRMLRNAIKNKEIEKRRSLSDEEVVEILISQMKQRKDSIEQFAKGGRQDLVEKETIELNIIQSFLPEQLSEDELREKIREAIVETGASGLKDFGKVMKVLMLRIKGKADGKVVSELVKGCLGGQS